MYKRYEKYWEIKMFPQIFCDLHLFKKKSLRVLEAVSAASLWSMWSLSAALPGRIPALPLFARGWQEKKKENSLFFASTFFVSSQYSEGQFAVQGSADRWFRNGSLRFDVKKKKKKEWKERDERRTEAGGAFDGMRCKMLSRSRCQLKESDVCAQHGCMRTNEKGACARRRALCATCCSKNSAAFIGRTFLHPHAW